MVVAHCKPACQRYMQEPRLCKNPFRKEGFSKISEKASPFMVSISFQRRYWYCQSRQSHQQGRSCRQFPCPSSSLCRFQEREEVAASPLECIGACTSICSCPPLKNKNKKGKRSQRRQLQANKWAPSPRSCHRYMFLVQKLEAISSKKMVEDSDPVCSSAQRILTVYDHIDNAPAINSFLHCCVIM